MRYLKKISSLFGILIALTFVSCNSKSKKEEMKLLNDVYDQITISTCIYEDIPLLTKYDNVDATWQSTNQNIITNDGIVTFPNVDTKVKLLLTLKYRSSKLEKSFDVTVLNKDSIEVISAQMYKDVDSFELIKETAENIELVSKYKNLDITWTSKNANVISSNGIIHRNNIDQMATLTAKFMINGLSTTKNFQIKVLRYTDEEIINNAISQIDIPSLIYFDITDYMFVDIPDDFNITWETSNDEVINKNGIVYRQDEKVDVKLSITISNNKEVTVKKDFNVTVYGKNDELIKPHQIIESVQNFDQAKFYNVKLDNDKLVLVDGTLEGFYESNEITTINFKALVASWAAISSTNQTAELMVKVKVGDVWSDYVSYGTWGFGLENKCYDQNNGIIKLSDDEIIVINGRGVALKYKIILRRTSDKVDSPKLSLVSFALECDNYEFKVDVSKLVKEKIYDVPRLCQNDVPTIGNSICSPTTSTMLLKYKGEDFSSYDEYEHRYIAYKFKEYNSNIFGNWVYNTVGMSSFGYDAYVARMYSIDELVYHLATVGPCGLSVKGQMTSSEKSYYTNGHLIVAIGYKYINNILYIICNDPNVPNVYCEYSVNVINNTWRNIAYVIK